LKLETRLGSVAGELQVEQICGIEMGEDEGAVMFSSAKSLTKEEKWW